MALELRRGFPVLLVNYGTGTTKIEHSYKQIVDNNIHKIEIILSTTVRLRLRFPFPFPFRMPYIFLVVVRSARVLTNYRYVFQSIEMIVDDCKLQKCLSLSPPVGTNKYLNVNGPLQVGGTYMDLTQVALQRNWTHKPFANGFEGCIQNFTFNKKLYNLGMPSLSKNNIDAGCSHVVAESITFKFDWTFLAAILICLAILTSEYRLPSTLYPLLSHRYDGL